MIIQMIDLKTFYFEKLIFKFKIFSLNIFIWFIKNDEIYFHNKSINSFMFNPNNILSKYISMLVPRPVNVSWLYLQKGMLMGNL